MRVRDAPPQLRRRAWRAFPVSLEVPARAEVRMHVPELWEFRQPAPAEPRQRQEPRPPREAGLLPDPAAPIQAGSRVRLSAQFGLDVLPLYERNLRPPSAAGVPVRRLRRSSWSASFSPARPSQAACRE